MTLIERFLEYSRKQQAEARTPIAFDFKLFFVYHIAMMILFATQIMPTPYQMVVFASSLGILLAIVLIGHKVNNGWRWPGVSLQNLFSALANLVFVAAFLTWASRSMLPKEDAPWNAGNLQSIVTDSWKLICLAGSNPRFTPWFLAGAGIGVWNILYALKLTYLKQDEFLKHCKRGQKEDGQISSDGAPSDELSS